MKTSNLPSARAPLTDGGEPPTRPWYNFFRNINTESNAGIQAEIYVISQKLGSPDGTVENIPPIASGGVIVGPLSVSSAGVLPGVVTISLQGDTTPTATQYYGTDTTGTRGWYNVSDALGACVLADLGDVDATPPTDTYVLTWDAGLGKWKAAPGGGGGGSPLTTKGDLYGFDTIANRIPVGGPGTFLAADSTAALGVSYQTPPSASGGYAQGTSFPGSPSLNQKFYRTDVNLLCYYDGTRWLTCELFTQTFAPSTAIMPYSASVGGMSRAVASNQFPLYLVRFNFDSYASPNSGSAYWTVTLQYVTATNTSATIVAISTASDTSANWVQHVSSVNAPLNGTAKTIQISIAKVGSPGNLYLATSLEYRMIIT